MTDVIETPVRPNVQPRWWHALGAFLWIGAGGLGVLRYSVQPPCPDGLVRWQFFVGVPEFIFFTIGAWQLVRVFSPSKYRGIFSAILMVVVTVLAAFIFVSIALVIYKYLNWDGTVPQGCY
jgi:hypothetical protein